MKILFLSTKPLYGRQAVYKIPYTHEVYYHISPLPFKLFNEAKYDLGVSFLYNYKVPKEAVTAKRWVNFHPGPLPEYGGRNIIYHAIMNGTTRFGVTAHLMTENFDDGPILCKQVFSIPKNCTAEELHNKTIETLLDFFPDAIEAIIDNKRIIPKKNSPLRYYEKEEISPLLDVDEYTKRRIRAITCGSHYPVIDVDGRRFKVIEE